MGILTQALQHDEPYIRMFMYELCRSVYHNKGKQEFRWHVFDSDPHHLKEICRLLEGLGFSYSVTKVPYTVNGVILNIKSEVK